MFNLIVADPAYGFSDSLKMSSVKRGAEANYKGTLSIQEIKDIPVKYITADDSLLALWVPSSLLQEGLDIMKEWGFSFKQTHIWIKTKQNPLKNLLKQFSSVIFGDKKVKDIDLRSFDLNNILAFGMGRLFRQTHEICLIGIKGKIYKHLKNKSQRSVHFYPATKHSTKPEALQDMLEEMFPGFANDPKKCLELFARRDKSGWNTIGNECPSTFGKDIRYCLFDMIIKDQEMLSKYIENQIETYILKPDAAFELGYDKITAEIEKYNENPST